MQLEEHRLGDLTCLYVAALFLAGFVALAVRLKEVQIDHVASLTYDGARQSVRRVRTPGERGRILASDGTVLAANRPTRAIVADAAAFQQRTWGETATNIMVAAHQAAAIVGRAPAITFADIDRHLKRKLARPLTVWRDVTDDELARFAEHEDVLPGFACEESSERIYPQGSLAAHLVGYVGRDRVSAGEGDERFNYIEFEMKGRGGLEDRYDSFLRGSPGEMHLTVDARGFARREWTVVEPQKGPDLVLSLDLPLQREAERQLADCRGACVVLDPRDGAVLAMASSPGYDPNDFVPTLPAALWERLSKDPAKPLLNRATGGSYAPGSTFKPITALAGLKAGLNPHLGYECTGAYSLGRMRIRCSHAWGHATAQLDLAHALKESCNPYFCDFGARAGTNAVITAARSFGLGSRTGIDFASEAPGVVPDEDWKLAHWREKWYPGDLPQMSIGQGMLLVTPLQMARVAGAIGTGYLVTPHLKAGEAPQREKLPYRKDQLDEVRTGMRLVVSGGTGRRAGQNLNVSVAGKTGTAEVGTGATRRKNTWFIAYAPVDAPTLALAIVVENGDTGGLTAAPRAREILKARFGARDEEDAA